MKYIKRLEKNVVGTDYFVGDIHGCYDILMAKLEEINFDRTKDRLISVGDLADRGPDSPECVMLIEEPWFHAVRGNHEDMAIGVHRGGWPVDNFISNGGHWMFNEIDEGEKEYLVKLMEKLPYIIEVETDAGLIGVLHADALARKWSEYHAKEDTIPNDDNLLWGRSRIGYSIDAVVEGVKAVVVGHTPLQKVALLGNVVYIDTGAVYTKVLTVMSANQIMELV